MSRYLACMGGPADGAVLKVDGLSAVYTLNHQRYHPVISDTGNPIVNGREEILLFPTCCAEHEISDANPKWCCPRCLNQPKAET